jgi:putative tricarboxylic transport membrane protein
MDAGRKYLPALFSGGGRDDMTVKKKKEEKVKEEPRPKGEYKVMALLFLISMAFFIDSIRSEGIFQGVSNGPGSIPQIVSGSLVLIVVGLAIQYFVKGHKDGGFKDLMHYLFDKEVVILLTTITIYGSVVEIIHFIPATILFLISTMYLLERKNLIKKMIISLATVGVLVLIFSTLFQVVLP